MSDQVERCVLGLYERIADLPLSVEATDRTTRRRERADGTTRVTSTLVLLAGDAFGAGEDVTHHEADHEALPEPLPFDLAGEYTLRSFSRRLDETDLFPTKQPERSIARRYRRWALESAALDLALTQAGTTLAAGLGRERSPVRFVARAPIPDGDPARVEAVLAAVPGTEFRLEPDATWTRETVATLAATDAVRILDLHGRAHDRRDGGTAPRDSDRRVLDSFPDAIIEDPPGTDGQSDLHTATSNQLAWEVPIRGVDDLRELGARVDWCVVTPSRLGTLEALFDLVEYCERWDIDMYGGGQAELCVGRAHVQLLASLFYPDAPNDVAPRAYTDPEIAADLPPSPLPPPATPTGLEWTGIW